MDTKKTIYSTEDRVKLVKFYYQGGESYAATVRRFTAEVDKGTTLKESTVKR